MTAQARGGRSTTGRAAATKKKAEPAQDPDAVFIDLNDFSGAEIDAIEALTGVPITHASMLEKPQGAILRAMAWVARVRDDVELPYDDDGCDRGVRPRCGDCHCSRKLKVFIRRTDPPVPPSGENG